MKNNYYQANIIRQDEKFALASGECVEGLIAVLTTFLDKEATGTMGEIVHLESQEVIFCSRKQALE